MKRLIVFSSILSVFFLSFPTLLPAAGNINFGNLKIIPSIEGQVIYDDNIYMKNGTDTATDRTNKKVSDTIYHVRPGLLLSYDMAERVRRGWAGPATGPFITRRAATTGKIILLILVWIIRRRPE
ncbi:MAG: hypothetical protein CSYNP_03978 [Syntrophus sp. SKADARSKE-3]|nr:hypothetical protein [Syntrophus sp. SKADARSKE-3]